MLAAARCLAMRDRVAGPSEAAAVGAGIGILGGLIGLGGAEFRLPVLVRLFGYRLRPAVAINLTVSLVTVLAAAVTRVVVNRGAPAVSGALVVALAVGGMVGASIGPLLLSLISETRLRSVIQALLGGLGTLLIVEALVPWEGTGFITGTAPRAASGVAFGVAIGTISSMLGVAGGELIIPTLVFAFGVNITTAGTSSLLISIPTIVVGLWRFAAHGIAPTRRELAVVVVPMSGGSIVGATAGGVLAAFAPAAVLKGLLGIVLVWSAFRLLREEEPRAASRSAR